LFLTGRERLARAGRAYAENQPVRSALRRGDVSIAAVMREQSTGLVDRTLFEILLMARARCASSMLARSRTTSTSR
jgi:hypothetical protein